MLLQPDLQPGLPALPKYSKRTCPGRWAVCEAEIDGGCQHSCVMNMIHCFMPYMGLMDVRRVLTEPLGNPSVSVQVPSERWDIENTGLNRLEGRLPTRFAAFMEGNPVLLASVTQIAMRSTHT